MSKATDSTDYAALFEKVTGTTAIVEEQDRTTADGDREIDDDLTEYVDETARADGLDEAVGEPETG